MRDFGAGGEIAQIIEIELDQKKLKRVVGLRNDGCVMIWNWTKGVWGPYMQAEAAAEHGFKVDKDTYQKGAREKQVSEILGEIAQPRDKKAGDPVYTGDRR